MRGGHRESQHHQNIAGTQLDPGERYARCAGRPEILGTTAEFLDYFGLSKLEQLPPLAELKALTELNTQLELDAPSAVPALPAPGFDAEAAAEDMDSEGDPLTATLG